MAVTKTAAALLILGLIVGVVAGYRLGFMSYQPEISRLQTDLSTARSEIDSLETQVSGLTSQVTVLKSGLEGALSEVTTLETKASAINEACVQLEKDFVFLETLYKVLITEETLEEELALWSNVREPSGEVDATLPSKIDAIMDDIKWGIDVIEREPAEDATWEELALWENEAINILSLYNVDYYVFEASYISAIQSHIIAVAELTES